MECHLVVATVEGHLPLCNASWVQRGLKQAQACGHSTEHQARKARKALETQGVHVMVRRGPCPAFEKFERTRAAREKRISK